jgi:ABC-type bacteriocin/lantibiotic exporter with double-glycine peptidase domain
VGLRSTQFNMLADNVSGRIRSDYFASIATKDLSFFDRVNVGEIRKSKL